MNAPGLTVAMYGGTTLMLQAIFRPPNVGRICHEAIAVIPGRDFVQSAVIPRPITAAKAGATAARNSLRSKITASGPLR